MNCWPGAALPDVPERIYDQNETKQNKTRGIPVGDTLDRQLTVSGSPIMRNARTRFIALSASSIIAQHLAVAQELRGPSLPDDLIMGAGAGEGPGVHVPNFAEEKELRAIYRAKVAKYEVEYRVRDMIFCDGNNPLGAQGLMSKESKYAIGFLAGESDWLKSCSIETEPDPAYLFCDSDKKEVEICAGGKLDLSMLKRYGDVGQDCGSWQIVYDFISGDATVEEAQEKCKRHLNAAGCQRDD